MNSPRNSLTRTMAESVTKLMDTSSRSFIKRLGTNSGSAKVRNLFLRGNKTAAHTLSLRKPRLAPMGLVAVLCLVLLGVVGCTKRAKDPVDQEKRAVEILKGRPWYDSEKMAYRPPSTSPEVDSPVRLNGWEEVSKPPVPTNTTSTPWNWGAGSWDFSGGFTAMIWLMLGALLVLVAFLLAGSSMKYWGGQKKLSKQSKAIAIDPARVVDLPFDARVEMEDPLEAARRMASAGDYDGAVLFLYGYMLLALDRAGQIVLHRGKTNRMYMFELGGQPTLRELLQPAMLAFEDVFFGRHTTDRQRFMQLWNNLELFHRTLEPIMKGRETLAEVVPT